MSRKKILEATAIKETASTLFNDPILKMAVNAAVDNAPGIELVHCEDCKHFDPDEICYPGSGSCWFCEMTRNFDDFCSYGEREEK